MTNTDREALRQSAYNVPSKLEARQRLWTFTGEDHPARSRISWSLELRGDETVIDIGCGNGNDLQRLHDEGHRGPLIGVDFSPGMLAAIPPETAARACGDAVALPLRSHCADVVAAMHMLYHVPIIPNALRDIRRVLRPDGVFIASTNSAASAEELIEPWSAAMVAAGGPSLREVSGGPGLFTAENGTPMLAEVFADVTVKRTKTITRVPDARIVRDYVASTDDLYEPMMPSAASWTQVLDDVEAHAAAVIRRRGAFAVGQRGAIFICR
jgi:ubiquinone/menaquinone biosynthesis C-methylase UbiE